MKSMKMEFCTIYSPDGESLLVNACTAERLGLRNYQRIYNREEYHKIAMQSAIDGIAICQLNIAMNSEFDAPESE